MTMPFPPDTWSMKSGTWGVDALDATDQTFSGPLAVKFPITGSNTAAIQSTPYPLEMSPLTGKVNPGLLTALVRADSIAAGTTVQIVVEFFDKNLVSLGTITRFNAALSAANTWLPLRALPLPVANAAFMAIRIGKAASTSFNLWVATGVITHTQRAFRLFEANATTLLFGAFTKVLATTPTADYDIGAVTTTTVGAWNPSGATIGPNSVTLWHFDARAEVAGMVDQKQLIAAFFKNGAEVARGTSINQSGTAVMGVTASADLFLVESDTVDFRVFNGDTVNRATSINTNVTWFSGHEVSHV